MTWLLGADLRYQRLHLVLDLRMGFDVVQQFDEFPNTLEREFTTHCFGHTTARRADAETERFRPTTDQARPASANTDSVGRSDLFFQCIGHGRGRGETRFGSRRRCARNDLAEPSGNTVVPITRIKTLVEGSWWGMCGCTIGERPSPIRSQPIGGRSNPTERSVA